jgi:hypothetical protein
MMVAANAVAMNEQMNLFETDVDTSSMFVAERRASVKTLDEVVRMLIELKAAGYVRTHRAGQAGIGKTLEDLLGIKENNLRVSNMTFAEIKSARKGSQSMLTLFTKSPLPQGANAKLLERFGYVTPQSRGRKVLHSTTWATGYNVLRGQKGFKVDVAQGKLILVSARGEELGYWDEATLKASFEAKLHHLVYVLADCRGAGKREEFWFNEAWLLSGFSFEGFVSGVRAGIICVDTRIGQNPDGTIHDHGTGFRVFPDNLQLCFAKRERLV